METSVGLPTVLQKILLSCGILAPLLYLGTDRLAGKLLKGYNFAAQSISELSADGSPMRSLVVSLTIVACVILVAFSIGVWHMAGPSLLPRIVSGLIIGRAVAELVASFFFPNRFGVSPSFGSPGVIIMLFSVVFFVLAMVLGAVAFAGWLRILSIAIPATYVILAFIRFATAANSSIGKTLSLVGAQERTMVYSYLVWLLALAIYLLQSLSKGVGSASHLVG